MKMNNYLGVRGKRGDVGIEIEVEGSHLPRSIPDWLRKGEGSLRGKDQAEYIIPQPIAYSEVYTYLKRIKREFEACGALVLKSDRTSVHVHINVSEEEVLTAFNMIFTYLIFEKVLLKFCGKTRTGNLFCLSSEGAEGILFLLKQAIKRGDLFLLSTDEIRYASINLKAIIDYGSLEFRGLEGTMDFEKVCHWVKILSLIKEYARKIKYPREILENFSIEGPNAFFKNVFKEQYTNLHYPGWERDVMSNMRNIQLLIFSGEWKNFELIIEPNEDI